MIKVLIADDEVFVLEGLQTTINWEENGFSIVGVAKTGTEALAKFHELKPDIIITDIKMPGISGLEFISAIRETGAGTELVVVTAYDDFSYAKHALENNVFAYILKPIKTDYLLEIMIKLKAKIESKEQNEIIYKNYSLYQSSVFLSELLHGNDLSLSDIEVLCIKYGISLPNEQAFIVIFQIDNSQNISDIYSVFNILNNKLDYCISISRQYIIKCKIDDANIVMLMFDGENMYNSHYLGRFLSNIKTEFNIETKQTITIGVSGVFKKITFAHRAYIQALTVLSQKSFLGNDIILDATQVKIDKEPTPKLSIANVNTISNLIIAQNGKQAISMINKYFESVEKCQSIDITAVKSSIIELSITLIKSMTENVFVLNTVFDRIPQPAVEIQKIEMLTDLKEYIIDFIKKIISHPEIYLTNQYSVKIQQAILYIMKNFSKHITLEQAAAELFITPSHLMHLFKKEINKTFIEYLTEYRINIATKLLSSGKYKIYEVSNIVGYNDSKHFAKTFKKLTGQTPSQFVECK